MTSLQIFSFKFKTKRYTYTSSLLLHIKQAAQKPCATDKVEVAIDIRLLFFYFSSKNKYGN